MELNFDIGTLVCVFALYGMWTFGKDIGRLICDVTLKVWKSNKNIPTDDQRKSNLWDELGMTKDVAKELPANDSYDEYRTCPTSMPTSHESPNTPTEPKNEPWNREYK